MNTHIDRCAKPKKVTKLTDIVLSEVSLVQHGANEDATVVLFKSTPPPLTRADIDKMVADSIARFEKGNMGSPRSGSMQANIGHGGGGASMLRTVAQRRADEMKARAAMRPSSAVLAKADGLNSPLARCAQRAWRTAR